jgi:hypothetical protein
MSTETGVAVVPKAQLDVAKLLNSNVLAVIGNSALIGFEKASQIAVATGELMRLLDSAYMKPIMNLQGSRLGFKTDKDDKGGYREEEVKKCLIEAVLTGVQPFGNQFNIIAGNMYVTKEGFGYLLKNTKGLTYRIIPALPRIKDDKTGAAVSVTIKWTLNGVDYEQVIDLPIKMNQYMTSDAVIGKATRKARAWLFNTINDCEIADGDAVDQTAEVISSKIERKDDKDQAVKNTMGNITKEAKGENAGSMHYKMPENPKDDPKSMSEPAD